MNEPAFPIVGEYGEKLDSAPGMTLRDYFAAKALTTLRTDISFASTDGNLTSQQYAARRAYEMADAMLAERDK